MDGEEELFSEAAALLFPPLVLDELVGAEDVGDCVGVAVEVEGDGVEVGVDVLLDELSDDDVGEDEEELEEDGVLDPLLSLPPLLLPVSSDPLVGVDSPLGVVCTLLGVSVGVSTRSVPCPPVTA